MNGLHVYALSIQRELRPEERDALLTILPFSRRQRLLRTREDKQEQALCAYGLLHHALWEQEQFFGLPPIEVAQEGKPFFPHHSHIQFNLTHTYGAVACAVYDKSVGVDLERSRPPADTILHYYHMTDMYAFWEMWVHREAVAKCQGKGLAALTHWDDGLEQGVICRSVQALEGYHCAVATGDGAVPTVHQVPLQTMLDTLMNH